ncbi:MAG: 16S rRNA (cytosine(967)-C(5))-methyltransferase RsmB [Peptostreptococcaceae bacterium]|nr:16S rRNA (cytosine(967)-C(5))-methyltransferase RsmB [Peptostreptococcaceae bacterium]
MKTVRHMAVDLLVRIDSSNAYSNEILDSAIKKNSLSESDQRLLTRIFYGVLENKILIDYYISILSKIKITKLHEKILNTIRIAIYQIVFLDNIPFSAAVNESVKIANVTNKHSSGFVNGVLRNFIRKYEKGLLALPGEEDSTRNISVKYSLPEWLVKRLLEQFDYDSVISMADSNNQAPPVSLRVNTLKTERNELKRNLSSIGIETTESIHADDGLVVKKIENASITDNLYFKEGYYYIQDEASMMVSEYFSPKPGTIVYDLCAAPGGKTTHIAQIMAQSGRIRAFDLYEHRVISIRENAKRLGIEIIDAQRKDSAIKDAELTGSADRVLIDVPCSGIGILRRKPELRYRLKNNDLDDIVSIQSRLLDNAALYVKNHGFIVYSTCTVNYNENDKIIIDFLDKNKGFKLVDINKGKYPSIYKSFIPALDESIHTYPHRDNTDGFFICMIQKNIYKVDI